MSADFHTRAESFTARLGFLLAVTSLLFACERPEKAHPGCPGESFRSAKSAVDCICSGDDVLRAGSLECGACNPLPSGGSYCECDEPGVFSFDSRLDTALTLRSEQVTCGPRSQCPLGERHDKSAKECVACGDLECGGTCGACPVGLSCVSGQCAAASACRVQDSKRYNPDGTSDPLYVCGHGPGDVAGTLRQAGLPTGTHCDFSEQNGCYYDAILEPLVPIDALHPGCPGESSAKSRACTCPAGQVLTTGSLECADCEPGASGGAYCDCGENAVFSFDGRIDVALGILSEPVRCLPPADCPEGERRSGVSDECEPCGPNDCGTGCGLCAVGSTCISGKCLDVSACRVEMVAPPRAGYPCSYGNGDLAGFGYLSQVPSGVACAVTPGDSCEYFGVSEVLSK